ncbi:hypothetical protein BDV09DRAFT_203994 [Aspergillus tetrazonus]
MVACSQLVRHNNKQSQSDDDASSDVSEVFSDFESDSDSNTDLELDNEKRYADGTQEKLDDTLAYWNRYCWHIGIDPALQWKSISDLDKTVCFLYRFFAWRCDIYHGKNGRHSPGLRTKSSLETFWKLWHLVLKQETASGLCKEIICKVIALVAQEKELELTGRLKKNMYIENIAKFTRVLLTTIEMTFACSWQHIQILFFCQLAAYTASCPGALLHLRYQDIGLKLIRDPEGGQPRLFIFLKLDFTKRFLRKKALNEFKIPEIIFDPSLVLSPHVCLLSILFHIQGFKRLSKTRPVLDSLEKLYSLRVLDGLGQQELLLKDKLSDKFILCQKKLTITGFDQVTHLYNLQYAGAKAFNNSSEVIDALQNVDVDVDVQGIVRKTESQTPLVRFACLFSTSINPDQLFRLSAEESKSLNKLPAVLARQEKKKLELSEDWTMEAKRRYNITIHELRNEKQRQQTGKLVNTKVMNTLEYKSSMAPQYLAVIDALLTMPGSTLEAEYQRQIDAINALTAFCPKHINPPWPARGVEYNICRIVSLAQKADLLNHAELCHGIVVQG